MTTSLTPRLNGTTPPLPHLGIIRGEGEEAAKFLQGQLTQDFVLLGLDQARLAGFLSAKGRMQASFIGFKRSATEILLVCSQDLLAPTLKRLSMFVMRAKAKLTDASADFALYGVAGDAIQNIASGAYPAWAKVDLDTQNLVFLYPALDQPRALWIAPAGTPPPPGPALSLDLWHWSEVRSGITTLSAPVVDAFVPQMLNFESVGGVNFKKGCYPGQEIVARSQFRGTLKRRTYVAHADQALAVGDEVFQAADPEQPCGTVVQVAPAPDGGFDALVSMQIAAAEAGNLHAVSADGAALRLLPLPYALLEDI